MDDVAHMQVHRSRVLISPTRSRMQNYGRRSKNLDLKQGYSQKGDSFVQMQCHICGLLIADAMRLDKLNYFEFGTFLTIF